MHTLVLRSSNSSRSSKFVLKAQQVSPNPFSIVNEMDYSADSLEVTETITSCTSTMTRPICHTSTPGYPCYPCIIGTPAPGDTATVTRVSASLSNRPILRQAANSKLKSSCTLSTDTTATITGQLCSTCQAITYTTSIPGYSPGGGCKACQPYESGSSLTLPPVTTVFVGQTATDTVVVSKPHCPGCSEVPVVPAPASVTTILPGNPGLPDTAGPEYGAPPTAVPPSSVPYKPTTVPPHVTVAGSSRGVVWELGAAVIAAFVYAVLMV